MKQTKPKISDFGATIFIFDFFFVKSNPILSVQENLHNFYVSPLFLKMFYQLRITSRDFVIAAFSLFSCFHQQNIFLKNISWFVSTIGRDIHKCKHKIAKFTFRCVQCLMWGCTEYTRHIRYYTQQHHIKCH